MSDNYIEVFLEQENGDIDSWYAVKRPDESYLTGKGEREFYGWEGWNIDGTTLVISNQAQVDGIRLLLDEIEARLEQK